MKRVLLMVAVLSVFMHVGVAYASGPVGSVPPPQYPNWSCSGICNSSNGDWSLTAGSSMVTNVASLYTNENVVIDVNDLVVPSNACIDITVDTLHICTSANGVYPWTFSNVSGSYHQIQVFCSTPCQGNFLVSVIPISAPAPTSTPNPSFTATVTPVVPYTVTPPAIGFSTHTPSPTPTNISCGNGVFGVGGCPPTGTPTPTATACPAGQISLVQGGCANTGTATALGTTPTPGPYTRDCGVGVVFRDCNLALGGAYWQTDSLISAGFQKSSGGGSGLCGNYNTQDITCSSGYGAQQGFTVAVQGNLTININYDTSTDGSSLNSGINVYLVGPPRPGDGSTVWNFCEDAGGFRACGPFTTNILAGSYTIVVTEAGGGHYFYANLSSVVFDGVGVTPTSTVPPTYTPTTTPTPLPGVGSEYNCGLILNCNFWSGNQTDHWTCTDTWDGHGCFDHGFTSSGATEFGQSWTGNLYDGCIQASTTSPTNGMIATCANAIESQGFVADKNGTLCVIYSAYLITGYQYIHVNTSGGSTLDTLSSMSTGLHNVWCGATSLVSGTSYRFETSALNNANWEVFAIERVYIGTVADATATATRTPTSIPTVIFHAPTNTPTGVPSSVAPTATILANIDTCLGTIQDCNLALTPIAGKIGGIPGLIATPMAPLNTSVFSPFQTIGITRGGCLSFGKLPVVVPHIIWLASPVPVRGGPTATPNISGYVPISVTWTLPTMVGTPVRQGNFGPIDPIEFEPCNDPAFPTWGWDLSWNASTFFEWVGFFVWTIALIRRIFG